jgi:hypothetical protein
MLSAETGNPETCYLFKEKIFDDNMRKNIANWTGVVGYRR